jgi:phosphate transport system protein
MDGKETHVQQMLTRLRARLLSMGAAVGIALDEACAALAEGDAERAAAVVDGDAAINDMENEIDELALNLLARNQPVATDLRFIVGALRMVIDLERIGDEAASISERTILLADSLPEEIMDALGLLMHSALDMYKKALHAFRTADMEAALSLCRVNEEIARQEVAVLRRIMACLCAEPRQENQNYESMHGILVCRSLNRICRRCSNMAEHTCFIVEGLNVKHRNIMK